MPAQITITLGDDALAVIANAIAQGQVPAALQGIATPVSGFPTQPAPGSPQASPAGGFATPATQPATAPPSDPWSGQQPAAAQGFPTAPNAAPSQPVQGGYSAPAAAPPSSGSFQTTDRFGNTYTHGLPNAFTCKHGERAVLKSGTSKAGNAYSGWVCPKAADSRDYKNACDFYQKA